MGTNPALKEITNEAAIKIECYNTYVRILNYAGYRKPQPRKKDVQLMKDK